ncbi:MAG: OmpA family protein [Bacteroidales bacterium]|nr:OmpA family protein [Bacteroidales bacterium]
MNNLKLFALLLSLAMVTTAAAQERKDAQTRSYPYFFAGIQGGAQTTFTNYDATKLITPIGGVNVGAMLAPAVGARLHVSGINNKGGFRYSGQKYDYNYAVTDLDLMLNLCRVFAPGKETLMDLYLIGGAGFGVTWRNDDFRHLAASALADGNQHLRLDDRRFVHNFRVGLQLEANVSKLIGINLEVTANNLQDRFNAKINGHGDWQMQALLGVNFRFGGKKKGAEPVYVAQPAPVQPAPVQPAPAAQAEKPQTASPAPVAQPAAQPQPKPEVKPQPKPVEQEAESAGLTVRFALAKAEVTEDEAAKIAAFAQWLKTHPKAKAEITGYADAGTGTTGINSNLSRQRVQAVAKILTQKHGISASRIKTAYKGDTVQPFAANDDNRVVIGTAVEK